MGPLLEYADLQLLLTCILLDYLDPFGDACESSGTFASPRGRFFICTSRRIRAQSTR